jgi:hypothetical protein
MRVGNAHASMEREKGRRCAMAAMRTTSLAPVLPRIAPNGNCVVRLAVPGLARQELEIEIAAHVVPMRDGAAAEVPARRRFRVNADASGV